MRTEQMVFSGVKLFSRNIEQNVSKGFVFPQAEHNCNLRILAACRNLEKYYIIYNIMSNKTLLQNAERRQSTVTGSGCWRLLLSKVVQQVMKTLLLFTISTITNMNLLRLSNFIILQMSYKCLVWVKNRSPIMINL